MFNWTGGTLNSSSYASTVRLSGATATINPGETNTILSGSTLDLLNSASLTVQPGTVQFGNGVGVVVENATVFINAQKGNGTAANVKLEGLNGTFSTANRIFVMKASSSLTASGAGIWDNQGLALVIDGGTVEIKDGAIGRISTPDSTTFPHPVRLESGTLRLHTGTKLTADQQGLGIRGGNLVIVGDAAGNAIVDAPLTITGGTISFAGNKAVFEVTGQVLWQGGTFMPRVNVTTDRSSDTWWIKGNLTVVAPAGGQPITATIAPQSENYVAGQGVNTTYRWVVIRIEGASIGTPQISTDGPTYQRYSGLAPGSTTTKDWMLGVP
jgi:hypothetical protein